MGFMNNNQWTTKEEVDMVKNLGKHRGFVGRGELSHLQMVEKYLASMLLRHPDSWEKVDPEIVRYEVEQHLIELRKNAGISVSVVSLPEVSHE